MACSLQQARHETQCRNIIVGMDRWTPERVQALRRACSENTAAFAARFARSKRTIEDWEHGRRNPDKLCQRMMDVIAAQIPLDTVYDKAV